MPITGPFPETGIRVEVERSGDAAPPWTYRGYAVTPTARWPMVAVVSAAGIVAVDLAPGAPDGTAERVRLMVRSTWKHAQPDGEGQSQDGGASGPPRRIVRWRDR
jgi:hypothetical protein